jgi:hypothetical protein
MTLFEIKELPDEKTALYNRPEFIETDPVRYDNALFGLSGFEKSF